MAATDWRGEYDEWFHLAGACQAVGISKAELTRWSLTDPVYSADRRAVERIWDSAHALHGGAFYKALAERGIKVPAANRSSLYPRLPLPAIQPSSGPARRQPTRNFKSRVNTVLDALWAKQDPDCLFWAACRIGEVMMELKKPTLKVAEMLLEGNCPKLRKAIGADEVRRIISNAFHHVEKEELESSTEVNLTAKGTEPCR
jgi:hypothetical protein